MHCYRCLWKKHSSGEWYTLEYKLSERQIRGWIAVSAAGLQGKGSLKRSVCFTDTGKAAVLILRLRLSHPPNPPTNQQSNHDHHHHHHHNRDRNHRPDHPHDRDHDRQPDHDPRPQTQDHDHEVKPRARPTTHDLRQRPRPTTVNVTVTATKAANKFARVTMRSACRAANKQITSSTQY